MKRILLSSLFLLGGIGLSFGQCPSGVSYQSGVAPAPGASTTMTTCAFGAEYQTVTGVTLGDDYVLTYTGGTTGNYVTLYDAAFTPIAWGSSPLSWTATGSGTFYSQTNNDDGTCGTENTCHTGVWANATPPPPCPSVITPWLDDVEALTTTTAFSIENCWTASASTGFDWNITAGGTPSSNTGALAANSGANFFYTEASGAAVGAEAILVTPDIDLTPLTLGELRFFYHMTGAQTGTLNVEISDDAGVTWNSLGAIAGEQQAAQADPWLEANFYLTGYTGLVQVRFRAVSNGSFEGDICLDDFSVIEAPTCPAPSNLILTSSDLTSGDFAWTSNGSETEWELEYGAPGFTPGTGTGVTAGPTPDGSITGLPSNMFYDAYVRAVCAVGDTSFYTGAITFNTYNQGLFMDQSTECPAAGFIDISSTGTGTALTDDGEIGVTLPFPFLYQGTLINDITIGNNGGIALGTLTAQVGLGGIVGAGTPDGLYPFWDDLDSEDGDIYYETVGTPGNQVFIVQYEQRPHFSGVVGQTITFQVQIEEATGEIYFVYTDVEFGGSQAALDFASSAGIGVAGPNQDLATSSNDVTYLTNNSCARYYYTNCPSPLNYTVTYTTVDEAGITWNAGLAGETDWTIIYGPAGFDPLTSGTTVTSTTPALIIPGLDDITTYDVYIYADCNPGVLQSLGATGSFTTLPNCADVTGLGALTASDSIFTSWTFVENAGFPSTGFDIEYGNAGYTQGMGTIVNADNNFTDTTADVTLLSGALYDVYVQSICGTDSSSFVGPFTVTMPLDNDSTCLSETLVVDGTVYTFDKTGATAQLNEVNITPPVTGYNTNDGWGQTGLNYSTWFTFEAPASGQVRINGTDQGFAGQMAVYDVTDCADFTTFTLMGANDDAITGSFSSAPNFTVCGLTPGNTYYLMHDANSTTSTTSNGGIYSVALTEVIVEGGTTNGIVDICVGDTVDLFSAIAGYDNGGTWYQETPTLGLNGSTFVSAGLAYQVFNFQYEVVDGCAMDSVVQQVQIYGPSSAGTDGTITVCSNEPVNLLSGLGGNADFGGTWYDPSNNVTPSDIVSSSIPGSFNYDYVTGNGVCPDDTANVIVSVDPTCDYLSIEEVAFDNMSIFPNPTNGSVFVTNEGSNEVFNFELTDVNGKVIVAQDAAINGTETIEVSLTNLESGFYLIRVFNDNADKTFRIIKE